MAQFKGTKEKVFVSGIYYVKSDSNNWIADFAQGIVTEEEAKENVKLFTDALHTIQECDLLPSQLLQWKKEAEEQLDLQQTYNRNITEENAKLKEALKGSLEVIENLIASKRIVNLDEAIAYYKQLLLCHIKITL